MLFVSRIRSRRPRVDLREVTGTPEHQTIRYDLFFLIPDCGQNLSVCCFDVCENVFDFRALSAKGGANLASRVHTRGVVKTFVRLRKNVAEGTKEQQQNHFSHF